MESAELLGSSDIYRLVEESPGRMWHTRSFVGSPLYKLYTLFLYDMFPEGMN